MDIDYNSSRSSSPSYLPPDWITYDFILHTINNILNDESINIKQITIGPACLPGKVQAYSSKLHRVRCDVMKNGEDGHFSFIMKELPGGMIGLEAHKNKIFDREIFAYTEILNKVQSLLQSIGDNTKISPACYSTSQAPRPHLILEDMCRSGFENFQQGKLLKYDYVVLTLKTLAKLHACSAVLAARFPNLMGFFNEPPISLNPHRQEFVEFLPANIRCLSDEIDWLGFNDISGKLLDFGDNLLHSALAMFSSHPKGFQVFNLCDIWVENLMFKLDENSKPKDVVLLDFQFAYYGSPATDINYFLYGSVDANVRITSFKRLIKVYHQYLQKTLKKLKYEKKIPTLKDIHVDLIRNSLIGVVAATCLTPMIFGERVARDVVENNEQYRKFLQTTLKDFDLNGFLDN